MKIISFDDKDYYGMTINSYKYNNKVYIQFAMLYKNHVDIPKSVAIRMLKKVIKRLEEIK